MMANGEMLPGADLRWDPHWLTPEQADRLHRTLADTVPWEVHRIRMFGKLVDSPRLSCWVGDPEATYRYSGVRFAPHPWTPELEALRDRLVEVLGVPFNSVLLNRYRDGRDAMGWHSDDEAELGRQAVIASVCLGATRRFALKHRHDPRHRLTLDLNGGSLLVMAGDTQHLYRHALPRTARPTGERINLTFRRILA